MSKPSRKIVLGDWQFHQIELKDKKIYERYMKNTQYPTDLWSSNFDYLWASSNPASVVVLWKIVNGMLVTFKLTKSKALQLAFPPLGKGSATDVATCMLKSLQFCQQWNERTGGVTRVRAATQQQLEFLKTSPLFNKHFRYVKSREADKHIGVRKVLELSGSEFREVRENRNRLLRNHPDISIRRARRADQEALLSLKRSWNETAGLKYPRIWDDWFYGRIIAHHKETKHIILVAEKRGQIIGMISGGLLPHGEAWSAFMKRKAEFDGLSELLNIEFAREIHKLDPTVEMINLGIESGLKKGQRGFKDKFRPVLYSERFQLFLK